jgi:hypothetical protein
MINNDSVHRALDSLERYAPAEDNVLAGFHEGVARRRKRRQVGSVLGVAGVAGLVALGVVLVIPGKGGDQPAGQNQAAAPPTSAEVKVAKPVPPAALPFTVSGVPAGYELETWEVSPNEGHAQYVGSKDFQAIVVWLSADPRPAKQAGDTEEATTIAGRPGTIRRLEPDQKETQVIWQLADGRWVMVGGRAPTVQLATLRTIADSLTLTPTPLPATVPLNVLPDGYEVADWSGSGKGAPYGGGVTLCRSGDVAKRGVEIPATCVNVSLMDGTAPANTQGKRGAGETFDIPVDQQKVVNGVTTRATADGTLVFAQLDAGNWVQAFSRGAGVDLLREVASTINLK